jgi:hypothetical protein
MQHQPKAGDIAILHASNSCLLSGFVWLQSIDRFVTCAASFNKQHVAIDALTTAPCCRQDAVLLSARMKMPDEPRNTNVHVTLHNLRYDFIEKRMRQASAAGALTPQLCQLTVPETSCFLSSRDSIDWSTATPRFTVSVAHQPFELLLTVQLDFNSLFISVTWDVAECCAGSMRTALFGIGNFAHSIDQWTIDGSINWRTSS